MIGWLLAVPAAALDADAPSPGEPDRDNDVKVTGATAGAAVALYRGSTGSGSAAGCALDLADPELLVEATADDHGAASLSFAVEAARVGVTDRLQAVERESCATSARLEVTWTVRAWVGEWDPEAADLRVRGAHPFDVLGSRVRTNGDADGDGRPDLVIAAPHEDTAGSDAGAIYLFDGPGRGELLTDRDESLKLLGEAADDWAGWGLDFLGDVDGDGHDDLVVSARLSDRGGPDSGAAYLVRLPRTGAVSLADADAILVGGAQDQLGMDAGPAGDLDGDGVPDLWVTSPYVGQGAGAAYLVPGTVRGVGAVEDSAVAILTGEAPNDTLGMRIVDLGDADGDGRDDVAVGAEGADRGGEDAGAEYVVTGELSGVRSVADADAILVGEAPGDRAGASTSPLVDLDGDGLVELGVNARGESTGAPGTGAFYVVASPLPADADLSVARLKLLGEGPDDNAGAHAAACDLDGDGELDLAVTAHEAGPGPETGRTYVFHGPIPEGVASMATADLIFQGDEDRSNVGQDVACADFDGDGLGDLAIGAEGDDNDWGGDYAGSVYVAYGRASADQPGDGDSPPPPADPRCGCAGPGDPGWLLALVTALGSRRASGGPGSGRRSRASRRRAR